jgi:hypothetical protein
MTGTGVTLYLILVMQKYVLAALAVGLFAHLIVFHVVITLLSRKAVTSLALKGLKEQMEN